MRILELFSGIGAAAAANGRIGEVVGAVDINHAAMHVYRANFDSPILIQEIASLSDRHLAEFNAEIWWMSPPCQPFTRRGLQRDLGDRRSKPLLRLISAIKKFQPTNIALENVVGFEKSETYQCLAKTLEQNDYHVVTAELCSTNFGLPNLRPRFFLAASRTIRPNLLPTLSSRHLTIAGFLDSKQELERWQHDLAFDDRQIQQYLGAINIVTPKSKASRCFTSAYGRSMVRSGSYLQTDDGFRRFSPTEMCRLMGFPRDFLLPDDLTTIQLWKLVGNSVSIPCARHVLSAFVPQLAEIDEPSC